MESTQAFSQQELIDQLVQNHAGQAGSLLPLLHDIQDQLGFIPASSVASIAEGLNLTRAEVHGVITYYHHFRSTAPGKHVIQVCRAEACQSCGSEELWALAEKLLGCNGHEPSANGMYSLEPVYCLGLCASSPAVQINDKLHSRVNEAKLTRLVKSLESVA